MLAATGQAWTSSSRTGLQSANGDEALRKVMAFENGATGSRAGLVIHRSTINGKSSAAVDSSAGCWRCASTSSTPAKKRVKYTPPSTSALLKRRRLQLHQNQNRRTSGGQIRPLDSSGKFLRCLHSVSLHETAPCGLYGFWIEGTYSRIGTLGEVRCRSSMAGSYSC